MKYLPEVEVPLMDAFFELVKSYEVPRETYVLFLKEIGKSFEEATTAKEALAYIIEYAQTQSFVNDYPEFSIQVAEVAIDLERSL